MEKNLTCSDTKISLLFSGRFQGRGLLHELASAGGGWEEEGGVIIEQIRVLKMGGRR